jgi:hypothetical protein
MEPGSISVARTLPIDGALLDDVLRRLRRDTTGPALRWTLGDLGSAEIDINFVSVAEGFTTVARVWDGRGLAVASVALHIAATAPDAVQVVLQPTSALTPWWQQRIAELLELAQAVINELAEELLWHATRAGVAANG